MIYGMNLPNIPTTCFVKVKDRKKDSEQENHEKEDKKDE